MFDLTKEERAEAARQGWGLFQIFDMEKRTWHMNVLPIALGPNMSVVQVQTLVLSQARQRHPLSLKALRLISRYNSGKRK